MKTILSAVFALGVLLLPAALRGAEPPAPLRVEGNKVLANGKPIRLRGINWGWWQLQGTRYTENDMKRCAEWGANVIRLAFYWDKFVQPGTVTLDEQKVKAIDEVISWAKKYGIYVILDMHTVPGGKAKNHCGIYKNKKDLDNFTGLWQQFARRYKNEPVVAAYELMNEPDTAPNNHALYQKTVKAVIDGIRKVDADKMLVVSGDDSSIHQSSLDEYAKQDDPNVLYTFHYYQGSWPKDWLGNSGERDGITGTLPWTWYERTFKMERPGKSPAKARLMLRSDANKGTAWFDDLTVTDAKTGKVLGKWSFSKDTEKFTKERGELPFEFYDKNVGHNAPGSLAVRGTTEYHGWLGPEIPVQDGAELTVSGWIKLEKATGYTYLGICWMGLELMTKDTIRQSLKKTAEFARKYNVPVFVGEFAVERQVGAEGYQAKTTADRIAVFEELGYHWTYWNFRETTDSNSMALHPHRRDGSDYPINEPLLKSLKDGWALNREAAK